MVGNVPASTLELWWGMFKNRTTWNKDLYSEAAVYKAFISKGGDHFRNVFGKARNGKTKKKPAWVKQVIWAKMQEKWAGTDPKFRNQSEVNKKNRAVASEKGTPIFSGGSVSTTVIKERLRKELGKDPTPKETFEKCHKKKDGSWAGTQCQETVDKYDQLLEEEALVDDAVSENASHSVDANVVWIKATGGVKKGRVIGMGSESAAILQSTPIPQATALAAQPPGGPAGGSAGAHLKESVMSELRQQMRKEMVEFGERVQEQVSSSVRQDMAAIGEQLMGEARKANEAWQEKLLGTVKQFCKGKKTSK